MTASPLLNAGDAADIKIIDSDITAIREEIRSLEAKAQSLGSQRNAKTITCKLPGEILSQIFIWMRRIDLLPRQLIHRDCEYHFDWMFSCTAVCSHWRRMALATPELWQLIWPHHPPSAQEFLLRSAAIPLRVAVDLSSIFREYDMSKSSVAYNSFESFKKSVRRTFREKHRISSLVIWASTPREKRFTALCSELADLHEAPELKTFGLYGSSPVSPKILAFIQHTCSSLRTIDISGAWMAIPQLNAPHLSTLTLSHQDFLGSDPDPSLGKCDLISLLRNLPCLETLAIKGHYFTNSSRPYHDEQPVVLPHLRYLSLWGPEVENHVAFLKLIQTHPLQTLRMSVGHGDISSDTLHQLLPLISSKQNCSTGSVMRVISGCGPFHSTTVAVIGPSGPLLALTLKLTRSTFRSSIEPCLPLIIQALMLRNVQTVEICLDGSVSTESSHSAIPAAQYAVLQQLTSVQTIKIHVCTPYPRDINPIFSILLGVHHHGDGQRISFPALRALHISQRDLSLQPRFFELLKDRGDAGAPLDRVVLASHMGEVKQELVSQAQQFVKVIEVKEWSRDHGDAIMRA